MKRNNVRKVLLHVPVRVHVWERAAAEIQDAMATSCQVVRISHSVLVARRIPPREGWSPKHAPHNPSYLFIYFEQRRTPLANPILRFTAALPAARLPFLPSQPYLFTPYSLRPRFLLRTSSSSSSIYRAFDFRSTFSIDKSGKKTWNVVMENENSRDRW